MRKGEKRKDNKKLKHKKGDKGQIKRKVLHYSCVCLGITRMKLLHATKKKLCIENKIYLNSASCMD
jgi:hypothetical protein